jgi:hypothetical protein
VGRGKWAREVVAQPEGGQMIQRIEPPDAGDVPGNEEFLEVRLLARTDEERQKLARLHVRCVENGPSDPFSVRWNVECGVDVSSRQPDGRQFRLQARGLQLVVRERNCQIDYKIVEEESDTEVREANKAVSRVGGGVSLRGQLGGWFGFGSAKADAKGQMQKERTSTSETVRKARPYRVQVCPDGWLIGHFDRHRLPVGDAPLTGAYPSWDATSLGARFKWQRGHADCDVQFELVVPADPRWLLVSVDEGTSATPRVVTVEDRRLTESDLALRARLSEVALANQLKSSADAIVLDRAVVAGRRVPSPAVAQRAVTAKAAKKKRATSRNDSTAASGSRTEIDTPEYS